MPSRLLLLGTCLAALSAPIAAGAQPRPAKGVWSQSTDGKGRMLTYTSEAAILGQETRVEARFYCNPEKTKMTTGAIGFELEIANPEKIKSFHFDDFEGPDAVAGKRQLLTAAVARANGTEQRFQASPSGSYSVMESFVFEVSEVFYRTGSPARKVLEALRTEASSLRVVIVDDQVSTTRIELTIPMTGRSDAFRWLLADLK